MGGDIIRAAREEAHGPVEVARSASGRWLLKRHCWASTYLVVDSFGPMERGEAVLAAEQLNAALDPPGSPPQEGRSTGYCPICQEHVLEDDHVVIASSKVGVLFLVHARCAKPGLTDAEVAGCPRAREEGKRLLRLCGVTPA